MQTFKLNTAMANMVDLDRIVDFYCVAMDIFHLSQKRYGLDVHRSSLRGSDRRLSRQRLLASSDFLVWNGNLNYGNYQATALARRKINTPSHSQVIKPIYKAASYPVEALREPLGKV
jgi:hypothetical protein